MNKFMYNYLQKMNLNQRVDDPNIPSNALEMMIDFDMLKLAKMKAAGKAGYNAYTEATKFLAKDRTQK